MQMRRCLSKKKKDKPSLLFCFSLFVCFAQERRSGRLRHGRPSDWRGPSFRVSGNNRFIECIDTVVVVVVVVVVGGVVVGSAKRLRHLDVSFAYACALGVGVGGSFAYLGPPPLVNERALPLRLGRSTHRPSAEPDEVLEKPGEKTSSTRRSTRNRHPKQPTKPTRRRRRRRRNRLATPATAVGAILYANERGEPRKRPIAVVKCGHHRDCSVLSSFFCLFVFLLLFFFHPVFHFVLFFVISHPHFTRPRWQ